MSNDFNKLLLQTLERIDDRLNRIDDRFDRIDNRLDRMDAKIETKADKSDVDALREEVHSHGQRLDRIETGIKTLQWTMTAGLALMGIILAFMRAC